MVYSFRVLDFLSLFELPVKRLPQLPQTIILLISDFNNKNTYKIIFNEMNSTQE